MYRIASIGIMLIVMMSGCGGTTGGTKPEASTKPQNSSDLRAKAGPAVSVAKRINYGKHSNVPDKVKAECTLDTQLPAYIKTFAGESDIAVKLKDGAVNKKSQGQGAEC